MVTAVYDYKRSVEFRPFLIPLGDDGTVSNYHRSMSINVKQGNRTLDWRLQVGPNCLLRTTFNPNFGSP